MTRERGADILARSAHSLTGAVEQYDPLLDMIGNARLVLLGEASHGTHEFYRERGQITKRLITEKGFHAVTRTCPRRIRPGCKRELEVK